MIMYNVGFMVFLGKMAHAQPIPLQQFKLADIGIIG